MEGIQKDVNAIQQHMMELQLSTVIETSVIVKTNKEETKYFFDVLVNINGEFEPAIEAVNFNSAICYLSGLSVGYEMAMADTFKKIHQN